jgi:hypothetical protein
MPTGYQINGVDIIDMVETNGTRDDVEIFRTYFASTIPAEFPKTKFNPSNCSITNSANTEFNCYKVGANWGFARYTFGPTSASDWSGLACKAVRHSGSPRPVVNITFLDGEDGNSTAFSGPIPSWCNKISLYMVGGGGGGGGKGGPGPVIYPNPGNGADGTNGSVKIVEDLSVVDPTYGVRANNYSGNAGDAGMGGWGTGGSAGNGKRGGRSRFQLNTPIGSFGSSDYNASGGAAGNTGLDGGPGGRSGNVQGATPTTAVNLSAQNAPASFPPTLQVASPGNGSSSSIGGYGNGQASNANTPGNPGQPGMVAIFFKR